MIRLLPLVLALFSSGAMAGSGDVWIASGFVSRHIPAQSGYQERNQGAGVQYEIDEHRTIVAGEYSNSIYSRTDYLGAFVHGNYGGFQPGFVMGVMNGYRINNGGPFFGLIPTVGYEYARVGASLVFIPGIFSPESVLALQVKYKIWDSK